MVSVTAPCIAAWLLMPCKARNLLRKLRSPHDSMLPSKDQSRIPSSSKVFATSSGTTIRITFSPSINPSVSFSRISLFLIQQVLNFCRSRILVFAYFCSFANNAGFKRVTCSHKLNIHSLLPILLRGEPWSDTSDKPP